MLTFADPLQHACELAPDAIAVIDGDVKLSFGELGRRAAQLAGGLKRLGLLKGDRVAILAKNSHAYIEAYVGAPAAGFVIVPLNTRLAAAELQYLLEDSGARVLLTDRDPGALSGLVEHTIRIGESYESLLARSEPAVLGSDVTENDLAGLFYTGGTTGRAKRRDAHSPQHHGQHVPQHDVACAAVPRDVLAHGAPLPRRGLCFRAPVYLATRHSSAAADVRCGTGARSHRPARRHRHDGRADDARCSRGGAAATPAADRYGPGHRTRRLADRDAGPAPGA